MEFSSVEINSSIRYLEKMETWNERLLRSYEKKFKSVAEFSRHSGVTKDSIHKYLKTNVAQPRGNTMELLASSLDVDLLWLKEGVCLNDEPQKTEPKENFNWLMNDIDKTMCGMPIEKKAAALVRFYNHFYPEEQISLDYAIGRLEGIQRGP